MAVSPPAAAPFFGTNGPFLTNIDLMPLTARAYVRIVRRIKLFPPEARRTSEQTIGSEVERTSVMNMINRADASTHAKTGAKPNRYARCIEVSKRVRWDIENDVIRGRSFDRADKYLPDGLSLAPRFTTLSDDEKRFVSQIQGRTYANVFGIAERFVNAKVLEVSRDHWFGDQIALEALVRFSDEELKHQALFRRIEALIGEGMPAGYRFEADANDFSRKILEKCTWAVLALTLDIELFTQLHYRQSIEPDEAVSALFRDVFLYHWKEESQHAILDELELVRHDSGLTAAERDRAVDEFIELVVVVDEILQAQAASDARYFAASCGRAVDDGERQAIEAGFLEAYRWQYIHSGAQHPRFGDIFSSLITEDQGKRVQAALETMN
jgi:hypothetical protein